MKLPHIFQSIIVCLLLMLGLLTLERDDNVLSRHHGGSLAVIADNGAPFVGRRSSMAAGPGPLPTSPLSPSPSPDVIPSAAFIYEFGKAALQGEAGSMQQETMLGIAGLEMDETPPLGTGMVNVTGTYNAYRMLPAGMVFNNDITVVLPYDSALLPLGYRPEDIMTYYYNETYKRWIAIKRDSVDTGNKLIVSRVDHFTDFINAVLQVPEMPETEAYVPTTMSGMRAANPLEGITLIQPPTPNNQGTAELHYPLDIPAGRQGMQPNLAVSYSSGGGNGWLGVGWDISVPAITVETRWGVPRYNPNQESEVYLYQGEQLINKDAEGNPIPLRHRTNADLPRLDGDVRFYPRVEESFDSIVRHGDSPSNYWWSVTDRHGVTYFYGKSHTSESMDPNSVLRGVQSIAQWPLTETRDPFGNRVLYYYDIVHDQNNGSNSGSQGKQIYLSHINYTADAGNEGVYNIHFNRAPDKRRDVAISGRYGFKEVSSEILCNIEVMCGTELLKCYVFVMENKRSSQYKTRMRDMYMLVDGVGTGIDGELVSDMCGNYKNNGRGDYATPSKYRYPIHYHFEYHDYPSAGNLYGPEVTYAMPQDGVMSFFLNPYFNLANISPLAPGRATALGATRGFSAGGGATVGFGIGPDVATTFLAAAGNYNGSGSWSEGLLAMVDIDGDGYPDKVFKKWGKVKYSRQVRHPDGQVTFSDPVELSGISGFLKESSNNHSLGLQLALVVDFSAGWPTTRTYTNTYFADVNGDGLPDIVDDEKVLFNYTTESDSPRFTPLSAIATANAEAPEGTDEYFVTDPSSGCGGIIFDGEVSDSVDCRTIWKMTDSVSVHNAVSIDSALTLYFNSHNISDRENYIWATGYEYSENYYTGIATWTPVYDPDCYFLGEDGSFWISSDDSSDMIYYETGIPLRFIYVFQRAIECGPEVIEPNLEAVKVWVAPYTGVVKIKSEIRLGDGEGVTSAQSRYPDGIRYSCQINRGVTVSGGRSLGETGKSELFHGRMGRDNGDWRVDEKANVAVNAGDIVFFRLQSGKSRVDDRVDWIQNIQYTQPAVLATVTDIYGRPAHDFNSMEDFVLADQKYFSATKRGKVDLKGKFNAGSLSQPISMYVLLNGNIIDGFTLHSGGEHEVRLTDIDVDVRDVVSLLAIPSRFPSQTTWGGLRGHLELTHRAAFANDSTEQSVSGHLLPTMLINNHDGSLRDSICHGLFGLLYRGWGQFAYNNTFPIGSDTAVIGLSSLLMPDRQVGSSSSAGQDTVNLHDTANQPALDSDESSAVNGAFEDLSLPLSRATHWVEMTPNAKKQCWEGFSQSTHIGESFMSNMRNPHLVTQPQGYPVDSLEDANGDIAASGPVTDFEIPDYDSSVPVNTENNMPSKTIRKETVSKTRNHAKQVSIPFFSTGESKGTGDLSFNTDYMDLNGDRYPDFIGESAVHYTNPWGGIGDAVSISCADACHAARSAVFSRGRNYGGTFPQPKSVTANNPKWAKVTTQSSSGAGGNYGNSDNGTASCYMDMNGDGLPDKVFADGNVALNLGYRFLAREKWSNGLVIRSGVDTSFGVSLGAAQQNTAEGLIDQATGELINGPFSGQQMSFSGGYGVTGARNETSASLADINGDGIPDAVEKGNNKLRVRYGYGNGQWSAPDVINIPEIARGSTFLENVNGALTLGFTFFGWLKIQAGAQVAPYNQTFSKEFVQIADFDNDGYPDYLTSNAENSLTVRYNQAAKTNLLKSVTNCTGAQISLDYALPRSSFQQPQRSWVMTEVKTVDHSLPAGYGANTSLTTVEYHNPRYDRLERIPFGYDSVVVKQRDPANNAVYRYTVEKYHTSYFNKRGKKISETLCDGQGRRYVEVVYRAVMVDLASGEEVGDSRCPQNAFPKIEVSLTRYYEGGTTPRITTSVRKVYDMKRNVVEHTDYGDLADADEFLRTEITYVGGMPHNLVSLPASVKVYDRENNLLRRRETVYGSHGRPVEIKQYADGSRYAQTNLEYNDPYGNVTRIILPHNLNNQRMHYDYVYDSVQHACPTRVTSALGLVSSAEYDHRFGKPVRTLDANGQKMKYSYDMLGRVSTVWAPDVLAPGAPYSLKVEHAGIKSASGLLRRDGAGGITPTPRSPFQTAITYRYNVDYPCRPVTTVTNVDGFGNPVQVLESSFVDGGDCFLVSGKTVRDAFGRTVEQHEPQIDINYYFDCISPAGAELLSNYPAVSETVVSLAPFGRYFSNAPVAAPAVPPATTGYDVLDRPTGMTDRMNNRTTLSYNFGADPSGKTRFLTTLVDANANSFRTHANSRNRQTAVTAPYNTTTQFVYNPLGELLRSVDPEGIRTSYFYDRLGRMTRKESPDIGFEEYDYDPAGNVTRKNTANLSLAGANRITYDYYYNLLTRIDYPLHVGNNVKYYYNLPGNPLGNPVSGRNTLGRLAFVEDAAGFVAFSYGPMGEVTGEHRTFVLPGETDAFSFKTLFVYDLWNRLREIVYPDGEKVTYHYDRGGQLREVLSVKNGNGMAYIQDIRYNKFGQREYVLYGNGSYAKYLYDALQRLEELYSFTAQDEGMQEIKYAYDPVDNITDIHNGAVALQNGLGGEYDYHHVYDNLYRLVNSSGSGVRGVYYGMDMDYTPNGKIGKKHVDGVGEFNGGQYPVGADYGYTYHVGTNRMKEVSGHSSSYDHLFEWDANGNMLLNDDGQSPRHHCWDEENRLMLVRNGKVAAHYLYDANGERVYKVVGDNYAMNVNGAYQGGHTVLHTPTLYASPYVVATPKGYTKHYYAGSERIASRIGGGGLDKLHNHVVNPEGKLMQMNERVLEGWRLHCFCREDAGPERSRSLVVAKPEPEKPVELPPCSENEYTLYFNTELRLLYEYRDIRHDEPETYFYHSDHLGSSSWITNQDGDAIQHLQYLPFGEPYVDQRTTGWNAPYTFSGKERDEETGYGYFGARYYDSDLSIWLSVDPLMHKYPSLSPYVYCANNPFKYIDPLGMTVEPAGEAEAKAYNDYKNTVNDRATYWQNKVEERQKSVDNAKTRFGRTIKSIGLNNAKGNSETYKGIQNELNEMESSSIVFKIRMGSNIAASLPSGAGGSITYNTTTGEVDINIGSSSLFNTTQITAHEFLHGYQYLKGNLDFDASGLYGGLFYDRTDEIAAFNRGNLFGTPVDATTFVNAGYSALSNKPKSYHLLSPSEKERYDIQKSKGKFW